MLRWNDMSSCSAHPRPTLTMSLALRWKELCLSVQSKASGSGIPGGVATVPSFLRRVTALRMFGLQAGPRTY